MTAFAVIRDSADLLPACNDLSEFLSHRLQQYPAAGPEPLIGLWLAPCLLEDLPAMMAMPGHGSPAQQIRVTESAGLSGGWTLYWLDPLTDIGTTRSSRQALLEALAAESAQEQGAPTSPVAFMPVFSADMETAAVVAEMTRLRDQYAHVLSPVFQDPYSGRLSLSSSAGTPARQASVALPHRFA